MTHIEAQRVAQGPPEAAGEETRRAASARAPRTDVSETKDAYEVHAEVPGVPLEAIDITVEENRLSIHAKRTPVTHEGHQLTVEQYSDGDYRRTFKIPREIERTKVHADLSEGVLSITLPKAGAVEPRKVEVRAA